MKTGDIMHRRADCPKATLTSANGVGSLLAFDEELAQRWA